MSQKSLDKTLEFLPPGLLAPPQTPDEIGRLAQYRIVKLIERGGMGMVFLAEDTQLRRSVALKIIRPEFANEEDSRVRFLREARAIAALKHDNVVTIYHVGEERRVPFLVMELLQGKSLKAWLETGHRASATETVAIGRQVAKALMAAHAAGLIHRDLKPGNLWLESPSGRVKLLDFGLVRSTNPLITVAGDHSLVGTPVFMSPEQARGDAVDARSDLFSLGSLLYLLATGRLPFQGASLSAIFAAIENYFPAPAQQLNPEIPPELSELIAQLMAKDPDKRPASAKAVYESLTAIQRTLPRTGTKGAAGDSAIVPPEGRYRWFLPLAIAAAVVLATAVIGTAIVRLRRSEVPEITATPAPAPESSPPSQSADSPASPSGPIDLLALVDTKRYVFRGLWLADGDPLVGQARKNEPRFALTLPWEPPAEYRLRLKVTRLSRSSDGQLAISLASGDARFTLSIDVERNDKHYTGLFIVDGRVVHKRPDGRRGKVLFPGVARELVVTVRPGEVALSVDGQSHYQWKGDLKRSNSESGELLRIGGTHPAIFRFEEIWLEPLGEDRGKPLHAE